MSASVSASVIRVRRRALPVVLAGMLATLSACTGEQAAVPTEADSTGGRPQLSLVDTCYGECAATAPLGLPTVAVYADGRVVASDRPGADNRVELRIGRLDPSALARLQETAVEAGLTTGGTSTLARATSGAADGSGTVLTVRLRSNLTTVEVPYLDLDDVRAADYAEPERVEAAAKLARQLRDAADQAEDAYSPSGYVVHARLATGSGLPPQPWSGPALGGFPAVDQGLRCGIVTGAPVAGVAQAVDADGFGGRYTDAGRQWDVVGRALLPHEQTCDDVRQTAENAQGTGPRFPGDTRPTP